MRLTLKLLFIWLIPIIALHFWLTQDYFDTIIFGKHSYINHVKTTWRLWWEKY